MTRTRSLHGRRAAVSAVAEAVETTETVAGGVLEIGELVVHYLPRVGLLGLRHHDHPDGAEAWFPLPPELVGPLVAWLHDLSPDGTWREWWRDDPEPEDGPDVVDKLGRVWRRRPGSHLWEQADGRGGVRTWRELTIANDRLVEAGGRT